MAGNIKQFDALLPTITGSETTAELAKMVMSFNYQMVQQLQFVLSNLDTSNFNEQGLETLQLDTTREIREAVKKLAGQVETLGKNLEKVDTDLQNLTQKVGKNAENIKTDGENIAAIRKDVDKILTFVKPTEGGGGTVGTEQKRLDLVGDIYMNGKPYGG